MFFFYINNDNYSLDYRLYTLLSNQKCEKNKMKVLINAPRQYLKKKKVMKFRTLLQGYKPKQLAISRTFQKKRIKKNVCAWW